MPLFIVQSAVDIQRSLNPKLEASYTVELNSAGADGKRTSTYTLKAKIGTVKPDIKQLQIFLLNAETKFDDRTVKTARLGLGAFDVETTGMPAEIVLGGRNDFYFLPIVGWYIPPKWDSGGHFDLNNLAISTNQTLNGSGYMSRYAGDGYKYTMTADLSVGERKVGKLTITSLLDLKTAWPINLEGKLTAEDGTVSFTMKKIQPR